MIETMKRFFRTLGVDVARAERRTNNWVSRPAWEYQSTYIDPLLRPGDVVIDVGCGAAPSPVANVLTDYFPDESIHRARPVVEDRPLVVCSALRMPFRDKAFDFSICSHVLEHVPDPALAAHEIARVSPRGYIETPSYGKDILVGTGDQHIWQVVLSDGTMHFFPYTARQTEAHAGSPFMDIWCQARFHPFQPFFWEHQDLFNAIHTWRDAPAVVVHKDIGFSSPDWTPVDEARLADAAPALTDEEVVLLEARLVSPDGKAPMRWTGQSFASADGSAVYPVRAKRVYFELGSND